VQEERLSVWLQDSRSKTCCNRRLQKIFKLKQIKMASWARGISKLLNPKKIKKKEKKEK
jgi:hypothetical protein